jgi:hypothetical protein
VGVIGCLALGVVFAMDGSPLAGDHTGIQPEPEPEKMRDRWMQLECPMRLRAVQVNRDPSDGDVGCEERNNQKRAKACLAQTVGNPVE